MKKKDYIEEAYDNCLKDAILLVRNSGFSSHGSSSNFMVITKDNELYHYHKTATHSMKNMNTTASLSKSVSFSEEQVKEIMEFVKKEVLPKDGTMNRVFDASYGISGKVGDKYFSVVNDIELTQKLKELINDMADKIIKENIII